MCEVLEKIVGEEVGNIETRLDKLENNFWKG